MMGEAPKAFAFDRKIYWSNVQSTRLDTKKLQENEPEIFDKYAKISNYRRFQIK